MTKIIQELIPDIYSLVSNRNGWFTDELANDFGMRTAQAVQQQFKKREGKGTLRMSKMGETCPCALWYSVHHPELAEPMPPQAEIKFSYGHMIEALTLTLVKAAGHELTGEQDALHVDGITGHRDCVIDGCIVDVKSANARAFEKYKSGSPEDIDMFGNLSQLDGYLVGSLDDPLVRTKDRAYILAVNKELGHMVLYEHRIRENLIRDRIERAKIIVSSAQPPACNCGTVAIGESGNRRLDTKASYNPFKFQCKPNLRTFIYAGKAPVYLTDVVRMPKDTVIEVDKWGKRVYNVV